MKGSGDLEKFIVNRGVMARLIKAGDAATSIKAATALGVDVDRIVKTVIFMDDAGNPHAVVLRGSKRVGQSALAKELGVKKIRLATRDEVAKVTGYEAGGVPPIDLPIDMILDSELASAGGTVYAGGGDSETLLEISIEEIIKHQRPRIIRI